MKVKLYATFRSLVGANAVEIETPPKARMIDIIQAMVLRWPQLRSELLNEDGTVSERIHLFVNGRDVRYMDGLKMPIPEDADIRIFPPVGGGA
jgi:molybdopterin synthase sulfur carrier subunit